MGGAEENSVIQTQQGRHTGELTEAVTTGHSPCTSSNQTKSQDREGGVDTGSHS